MAEELLIALEEIGVAYNRLEVKVCRQVAIEAEKVEDEEALNQIVERVLC